MAHVKIGKGSDLFVAEAEAKILNYKVIRELRKKGLMKLPAISDSYTKLQNKHALLATNFEENHPNASEQEIDAGIHEDLLQFMAHRLPME